MADNSLTVSIALCPISTTSLEQSSSEVMVHLAISSFLLLRLLLSVSANYSDLNHLDLSTVTINEQTSTSLHKRAPSPYLYGDPFAAEWQYENWDPDDTQDQKPRAEKIHQAFGEWLDMVSAALTEAQNPVRT